MKTPYQLIVRLALILTCSMLSIHVFSAIQITGEMKQWYPVIVTIDGPQVDESESTYRNYRLEVTFTKGSESYKVPGFFAADGNAGETSATSGNKWRAIFTPDEIGTWNYSVSLRTGTDIAISLVATAGAPTTGDAGTGSFTISAPSANEPGFFAKGKLNYVGEHYGQFAGNKEWFVKAGPGSPEDFFGYHEFDNTVDGPNHSSSTQQYDKYLVNGLHQYPTHAADWKTGDPTWKGGKGKAIIGVLNYLSSIGVNCLYMIPFTINDDADNTWPWTSRDSHMSYDVSKLAQWDIVFTHMDKLGISPLYYLCESSNSKFLFENNTLGKKYLIYYREIMARFGYHLGMRFNLGEELQFTADQQKTASTFLKNIDPYNIIVCGHSNYKRVNQLPMFEALLGHADYDGPNYQLHSTDNKDHLDIIMWRDKSAAAGKKWIVANDESTGIDNTSSGETKMLTLTWRTFMAGGEGMVQYTAYGDYTIGDITLENFRLIEKTQKILVAGKNLFQKAEINPFLPEMKNANALVGNPSGNDAPFCLAKKGEKYIVYRTSSTNQKPLDLTGATGSFTVKWYDAKNGGNFQNGSVTTVIGGGSVNLGNPPSNATGPWAIFVALDETCNDEKTISLSAEGYAGSSVAGGGKYCVSKNASVSAIVAYDAEFVNWTENGNVVSTANPYSFEVTTDRALVANFIKSTVPTYPITVVESSSTHGTVSGGGVFKQNQSVTVNANANACFKFDNWSEGENVVSTNPSYTFTVTAARDLKANFVAKSYTVMAEPAIGGTVSGELTYSCGAVITVTATPNADYRFDGWFANGTLLSASLTDDINITDDFQIIAKFSSTKSANYIEGSTITYYAPDMNAITHGSAKNVSIGKATSSPVIDGKDDEPIWQTAPLFSGQTIGKGNAEELVLNNVDAQLSWKGVWDETALYVVLKIKDDVQVWNDANKFWNIDGVEFYVTKDAIVIAETGNNLSRSTQAKVLWQNLYTASPDGRAIMEFRGSDFSGQAGTKTPVAGTSVARSYDEASKTTTFEIRYEWTKILTGANAFTSVTENDKIRLAFMFNDNDNAASDTRDHKVFYVEKIEPSANLSHKDWAVVTLKNNVTALKNNLSAENLIIYPNPASGLVSFSKAIDADFYNLTGQKVLSVRNSSKADISALAKGLYSLKTRTGQVYKLTIK